MQRLVFNKDRNNAIDILAYSENNNQFSANGNFDLNKNVIQIIQSAFKNGLESIAIYIDNFEAPIWQNNNYTLSSVGTYNISISSGSDNELNFSLTLTIE